MYVLGHVGISLLLYAPLAGMLVSTGQPLLAVLTGLVMAVLGPLPDLDTYTGRIDHRGPTHTVWFAFGVGLLVALAVGVILGDRYISSHSLPPLETASWFGGVATLAILGHLLGDLITPMGLWPFRPLSDWHHTVDLTPSKSPRANRLCFAVGAAMLTATLIVTI